MENNTSKMYKIFILIFFLQKYIFLYDNNIIFFSFLCQFLMMKNTNTVKLNNDWDKILKTELESNDLQATLNQIEKERNFQNIFPSEENVFKALKLTTFKNTKVIILGQDPYHSKELANGLAFSVPKETKQPHH